MKRKIVKSITSGFFALSVALSFARCAQAQSPKNRYPSMAPLDQHFIPDRDAEIALARTAAPPSISKDAAVFVLAASAANYDQSQPEPTVDPALATLGSGFVSDTAQVNGATLHYVRGGTGPPVILLHGFPEDWYAYHRVMPQLAKQFTVVAAPSRLKAGTTLQIWQKMFTNWRSICIWTTFTWSVTISEPWLRMRSCVVIRKASEARCF